MSSSQESFADGTDGALNGKIIIGSLGALFMVVMLLLGLHVYAKCWWRQSDGRQPPWRGRFGSDSRALNQSANAGLDRAVVEALPTFVYKIGNPSLEELECAVCLNGFQDEEKGRILPKCCHRFHTECIDMWFLSNTTCPLCRVSAGLNIDEDRSTTALLPEARQTSMVAVEESLPARFGSQLWRQLSLQSLGTRSWRRSVSDRFPQRLQSSSNSFAWRSRYGVSSRVNLEQWGVGQRSLPHLVIEIPRRQDVVAADPRSESSSPSYSSRMDVQSAHISSPVQPHPSSQANSLRRLCSRDNKAGQECSQA